MGTALITGGSRGMGRATALEFAERGHDVAVTYRTRRDEADAVVKEIESRGRGGLAVLLDVEDRATIDDAFAAVEKRFGKVDYLFANAGIFPGLESVSQQTWEGWRRLLDVNVIGQWYCAKLAIESMRKYGGGGGVLYNSSISGVMTFPSASHYAASKHAVVGMAKGQSLECARDGIRVNVICPGFFRTDMYDEYYGAATDHLTGNVIPAERIGDPKEIARLAYFLLAEGTYCSGSIVVADGGITAGPKPPSA
ncbi:MAG: SDR family NAD(P)-dependent oxidoreductase [Candidatus Binatia bacterium]